MNVATKIEEMGVIVGKTEMGKDESIIPLEIAR
jgi:hypothetical protein